MDRAYKRYESGPEASFTDNQYDMLDDLSEMSDGHDTASIASNGEDGQQTPDDLQSDADPEDSTLLIDDTSLVAPSDVSQSFIDVGGNIQDVPSRPRSPSEIRAENELIDSYWPDDMETPRQSTISPALDGPPAYRNLSTTSSGSARRILFISEQDQAREPVMDRICTNVTACLDEALDELSAYKVVRLPATPSGISLPSATVVHGQGRVAATVQHCVGVDPRTVTSYNLRILDNDGEHSSFFTVGNDAKVELQKPNIAVLYFDPERQRTSWLRAAQEAVRALNVPVLYILDSDDATVRADWAKQYMLPSYQQTHRVFSVKYVSIMSNDVIDAVSGKVKTQPSVPGRKSTAVKLNFRTLIAIFLGVLMPVAQIYLKGCFKTDPTVELATRREALAAALATLTNPSETVQDVDIGRLVPDPSTVCPSGLPCDHDVGSQVLSPNHFIISLPSRPRLAQLTAIRVYKSAGRQIPFTATTLISGVYGVTIEADDAYGQVQLDVETKKPARNTTIIHDFGYRMLQLRTYEKAGSEVGEEVSKDVALMKRRAKSLSQKLPLTIEAGMWATRNVTSQMALHMARDLQAIGSTAVSILSKAAQVGNETASVLSKDLVVMQTDIVEFTKNISTKAKSRVDQIKSYSLAMVRTPLERSRERLRGFRHALGLEDSVEKKVSQPRRCKRKEAKKEEMHAIEDRVANKIQSVNGKKTEKTNGLPKLSREKHSKDEAGALAKRAKKESKKHEQKKKAPRADTARVAPST